MSEIIKQIINVIVYILLLFGSIIIGVSLSIVILSLIDIM
jgi:hypothetical protein